MLSRDKLYLLICIVIVMTGKRKRNNTYDNFELCQIRIDYLNSSIDMHFTHYIF